MAPRPPGSGDAENLADPQDVAKLLRFAYVLCGSTEQSQDLVQAVLAKLWERGLQDVGDPAAYAKRAIVNAFVTERRRAVLQLRFNNSYRPDPPQNDVASHVTDRIVVAAALDLLGHRERAVIVLRYWEDLTFPHIAQVLGCRESTARSLHLRARKRMKHLLEEYGT